MLLKAVARYAISYLVEPYILIVLARYAIPTGDTSGVDREYP